MLLVNAILLIVYLSLQGVGSSDEESSSPCPAYSICLSPFQRGAMETGSPLGCASLLP